MSPFSQLHRFEYQGIPLYISPEKVDWFVPSSRIDLLLQSIQQSASADEGILRFCREHHQSMDQVFHEYGKLHETLMGIPGEEVYKGRAHYLSIHKLKELWFHLTDKCNLACRHCLFSASPAQARTLDENLLKSLLDQGHDLGARLFYFTGGEPFIYPNFIEILRYVLQKDEQTHAVVLTNGLLLEENTEQLRSLDFKRLHLQISLDGLEESHDYLRGKNTFSSLIKNIESARAAELGITISVAVNSDNISRLPDIARLVHSLEIESMHLMYHFVRGKGSAEQFVDTDKLFNAVEQIVLAAPKLKLSIDNLEILKSQLFSMPGTRYDLSNSGWESIAVGPDGLIYPSPALVGIDEVACGDAAQGLERVWRGSDVLEKLRSESLINSKSSEQNPFRFFLGGGDPDHSYISSRQFSGHDPYLPLHVKLSVMLIARQAEAYPDKGIIRLRMGDLRFDCPDGDESGSEAGVKLTLCNCVVSLAGSDGHSSVMEFYGEAANEAKTDIVNPFGPDAMLTGYIPEKAKQRSYGCGSPVQDGAPRPGETVVDLGSGSGVECFIAAGKVGKEGRVYGIDMTDDMLELARSSQKKVVAELGYDNVEFRKGFLENIPLPDNCADLVISNCVINLSPDKRRTYLEILRILKPGGRLVVSDIVTDEPVSAGVKNSARLRGECLGGAMQQNQLTMMLEDCGFSGIYFYKRSPYREVKGNRFFSLTYRAEKSLSVGLLFENNMRVMYRGPGASLRTDRGNILSTGSIALLPASEAARLGEAVFQLDQHGKVTNIVQEPCNCGAPPEKQSLQVISTPATSIIPLQIEKHESGCMECGALLVYEKHPVSRTCSFCGITEKSNSCCQNNHYICDMCHQREAAEVIRHICLTSEEKDLLALFFTIHRHPSVPLHGPEHHAIIPGVILASYRNNGGEIDEKTIATGLERGHNIPGGVCGFWGGCGAAIGAGIAASMILSATPLTALSRQTAQSFTAKILTAIGGIKGARCCQRESWTALRHTAQLSEKYLGLSLPADHQLRCNQYRKNKECIKAQCPLWDMRDRSIVPIS